MFTETDETHPTHLLSWEGKVCVIHHQLNRMGVKPTNIIKSTEAQTAVIAPEGKGKCAHKLSYSQVERG